MSATQLAAFPTHSNRTPLVRPATSGQDHTSGILKQLVVAYADGRLADGSRLMEEALALNVEWEKLTEAVREGMSLAYQPPAPGGGQLDARS